ncbi:Uncharacterised protein [Serratia proteamaculans]|nr:Uncharacterised protein [Serratia proteamaculans]SPZ53452.1 Uncharacterised protein [Serratia quinivorans]CAI0985277.1 Uncharacterised protein [Serratia proteamaculans]CAI1106021.1 Uncharacterised protein [Serratia proteamaculans]CAI1158027.1 Uncharacterised protein [Serratia proteamaculans]
MTNRRKAVFLHLNKAGFYWLSYAEVGLKVRYDGESINYRGK